jgi:CRP-like cAMP-binding protein
VDAQSARQLKEFFGNYKQISYKKQEMILRAEDTPSGVYFVESGYVREFSISPSGNELTLFLFRPNDVFPIRWAFTSFVNVKYFESFTEAVVWRAPQADFLKYLKEHPDLLFSLTNYILTRLGMLMDKAEQIIYGDAAGKMAYGLVVLTNRFGVEKDGIWTIPLPFTQKDLAALIGSTRETVSVEMQKLVNEGIITHEKQMLTIKNLDFLKNASHME